MNNQYSKKIFHLIGFLSLLLLLAGCDPAFLYHVAHSETQAIKCPNNEEMKYRVIFKNEYYKEEVEFTVDQVQTFLSTNPDHPVVGLVRPPEMIHWIQFIIYCGESTNPYLVTKEISVDDWIKKDEQNYYYYVK